MCNAAIYIFTYFINVYRDIFKFLRKKEMTHSRKI